MTRLNDVYERLVLRTGPRIVFGGGSNFHSAKTIDEFRRRIERAGPADHAALGVGIGPFRDTAAARACGHLLERFAFVGVRDRESYDRAREIAPKARIELTFDLAPLLTEAVGKTVAQQERRAGIGIALCNDRDFAGHLSAVTRARLDALAEALKLSWSDGAIDELVLLDFNSHPRKGDVVVHAYLTSRLPQVVPVRHITYRSDPLAVMTTIAKLRGIVAMRLHSAIFAFCTATPALILAYHEKCLGWAESVSAPGNSVVLTQNDGWSDLNDGVRRLCEGKIPLASVTTQEAIDAAMRNWQWAQFR
jgi:polysaccharide pyruvyl transferase WcaK-like protein